MTIAVKHISSSQVAGGVPYDDTIQGPASGTDDVQEMLDYLKNRLAVSAATGFTYGRSGNLPANTWLLNDTVPCNKSGRVSYLTSGVIQKIFTANEDPDVITVGIYTHDGNEVNLTLIGTVTTAAQRTNTFTVSLAVALNKQIAIRIQPGSAGKNMDVGLLMGGTL